MPRTLSTLAAAIGLAAVCALPAQGQDAPTICGEPVPPPARLPPDGSPPVVYSIAVCFSTQGNVSAIEPQTYLYYIQLRPSRPSQDEWSPWNDEAERTVRADFTRLWDTGFLEDLRIEADDVTLANGVVGKLITYHLEERPRIRTVNYEGSGAFDRSALDERLRERGIVLRLDAFLDEAAIRRVATVVRELMAEKGFANAVVTHAVTPVTSGARQVNVTFTISDGPQIAIRDIEFLGNRAIPDSTLARAMKENRAQGLLSLLKGRGRYNETKFGDDAENVESYYRDHGYVTARVGQPEVRPLDDSADGATRWVQLRIPVTEGRQYRVASLSFEGNTIVDAGTLRTLFKVRPGDSYSQKAIRDGLDKAREIYGGAGFMEFTGFPDLRRSDDADETGAPTGPPAAAAGAAADPPTVAVVVRVTEGPQYFVNRLTFTGNTTTRDAVIRREVRLLEGGVFNTEALKFSIRRLNQLGYFKPLEGSEKDLRVEKTPGRDNAVDVVLSLEEQNRNQVQFGAGMSQYDGVFGNLSYSTSNFMGRGESLTLTGQKGARSSIYQLAFTEPYLFDRPLTAGLELFSRKVDFLTGASVVGYSEVRSGINLTSGHALFGFSRAFVTYGYEVIETAVSDALLDDLDADAAVGVPVFNPLLDQGRHVESRITPSFVHNTVDNPFLPRSGRKLTVSLPVAGGPLGGTTNYVRPEFEAIHYIPLTRRTAIGVRLNAGTVRPFGGTRALPYYLRYFLGGEYQIRGVGIRTVGPTDSENRAIGGDTFVLFNAEYYLDLFGSVRTLLFHDAGQAFGEEEPFDLRKLRTSSGVELRVVMPVLNVPFRLIYAWNTYRDTFQPARTFKFAVGTTF